MKRTSWILISGLIVFSISCRNKCDDADLVPPPSGKLKLVDTLGNILIGPGRKYALDSISTTTSKIQFWLDNQDTSLLFTIYGLQNGDTMFLRLAHDDVDTMKLYFRQETTECLGNVNILTGMDYNGRYFPGPEVIKYP